jgi:D-alanyl-D-alanine carboxypeptidase/D-alanyl-D-alanine-endopeptidase (penicillin-binding protein 4)
MASLGVAGVDGTLKEKFSDPGVKRRIRAKTGTLRGVNALAGYGISPEGRIFAFAVIVNSIQAGTGIVDYADKISRAILDISMDKR